MTFVYFTPCYLLTGSSYVKLFGKAQVDVNLSLGQFVKVNSRLLFLILFCFIYSEIYERVQNFSLFLLRVVTLTTNSIFNSWLTLRPESELAIHSRYVKRPNSYKEIFSKKRTFVG